MSWIDYSMRRAVSGSTLIARRAGTQQAMKATAAISAMAQA